ncbi:MAG TPA: beta-L-arabinofuranosidase domain-containing protein, partial [Hanamia sp.]|nr:beta-L-arabinofuranosidase domain-containing protein [Hanamia sp.]
MKKAILVLIIIGNLFYGNVWAQEKLYPNEFNLGDVKLLDGPFKRARDLNIQTLLKYKVDRLLAPYLKEAGLKPKDSSYNNWEGLDGHIGGHYLTAMAINTATGNAECKKRMLYMIDELQKCQDANAKNNKNWGIGYVGGVPNSAAVWKSVQDGD